MLTILHFLNLIFKFRIAAFAAGISVFVFGQKNAGAAFGTEFVDAGNFVAFDFVIIFHCHVIHSAVSSVAVSPDSDSSAGASSATSSGSSGNVFL